SRVVLGLSGGIEFGFGSGNCQLRDRTGKCVRSADLPSSYSSDGSVNDALELAKNLGIAIEMLPIGDLMKGFDRALANLFVDTTFGIAEENLQSRIRGNLLMAISNKFGHLLLSTGNKSEMAVGYCTLYGDMNGGLSVISDVPKTRVYSLCNWLNSGGYSGKLPSGISEVIPGNIINKAPSAELKPGQIDQDSLPPYDILDDILRRLIEEHESIAQIVAAGHDEAVVKRTVQLVMRAEFKRRQAAPGLKISDRAFGTGWRMPIAKAAVY
ncbi:MAG: NAD(+) synthase, partial [Richelia sp. CSU_2_1]|nr:NAD(+) synthase [Richelia sp. CSU_2_1]